MKSILLHLDAEQARVEPRMSIFIEDGNIVLVREKAA